MKRNKFYIWFFMIVCFYGSNILAQENTVSYTPSEELISARDGIDYSDDVIKEKEKKETESYSPSDFNFSDVLGVLLILLLLGVVGAILYFVIGKENLIGPKSRKIKDLDLKAVEHIEEDLENQDVAYYLNQAINENQYRIAIRLHYLLIIKKLSENKFIKWKKDKTNRDYIFETSSLPFSEKFRSSTSIFEKVWYGERSVGESDFKQIYDQFDALEKKIIK